MSTVVVTGGTKGLGLSIVRQIISSTEFECIVVARNMSPELSTMIDQSDRIRFIQFDLSDTHKIYDLSLEIKSLIPEGPYGLVNNAAMGGDGILATQHISDMERIVRVNQISPILLSKFLGRQMLRNKVGHIINISSVVAKTGYSGLSVYASTKAALLGFSRSLAREYGKYGVCVNSLLPGFMTTDMTSGMGDEKMNTIARRSPTKSLPSTTAAAKLVITILTTSDYSINGAEFVIDAGNSA